MPARRRGRSCRAPRTHRWRRRELEEVASERSGWRNGGGGESGALTGSALDPAALPQGRVVVVREQVRRIVVDRAGVAERVVGPPAAAAEGDRRDVERGGGLDVV